MRCISIRARLLWMFLLLILVFGGAVLAVTFFAARDLVELRLLVLAATVLCAGLAVLEAVMLARRFTEPIETLVRESDRISRGILDGRTEVDSCFNELADLTEAQERLRASLRTLTKLEGDMQVARRIQQASQPDRLPSVAGFELAAWTCPADATGGDTYDVVALRRAQGGGFEIAREGPFDRVVCLVADATGHGVGPALNVMQVHSMLRLGVRLGADLPELLRHMNAQLRADLPGGRFVTLWLAALDPKSARLASHAAGQAPVLRFDGQGGIERLGADGPPLGVLDELEGPAVRDFALEEGELFAVCSDGLFEARSPAGAPFGVERAARLIQSLRDEALDTVLAKLRAALETHLAGLPPKDDVTVFLLRRR